MRKAGAATLFLFCLLVFGGILSAQTTGTAPARVPEAKAEKFYRTELYFGRSKPDGSLVTEEEWKIFLADTVTPRFPNGFTSIRAMGQYRDKNGRIITEPSEVLIFLYSSGSKNESRARIEEIRTAYIKRFNQESVLRVDLPKKVRVSF
jgi:hypothetical protein